MNGQLDAMDYSPLGSTFLLPPLNRRLVVSQSGIWTFCRRDKSFDPAGTRSRDFSLVQLVTRVCRPRSPGSLRQCV